MTLRQYFETYYKPQVGNVPDIIQKQQLLQQQLSILKSYYPTWSFIENMYARMTSQQPTSISWSYDSIVKLLTVLNIFDMSIEEFSKFLTSLNRLNIESVNSIFKINLPPNSELAFRVYDACEKISSSACMDYIRDNCRLTSSFKHIISDSDYYLPDSQLLKEIILEYEGDKMTYLNNGRRDCDDFALMFKAYLSKLGIGNLTCGVAYLYLKTQSEISNHALNLCLYRSDDTTINHIIYEPQSEFNFYANPGTDVDIIFENAVNYNFDVIDMYFLSL